MNWVSEDKILLFKLQFYLKLEFLLRFYVYYYLETNQYTQASFSLDYQSFTFDF